MQFITSLSTCFKSKRKSVRPNRTNYESPRATTITFDYSKQTTEIKPELLSKISLMNMLTYEVLQPLRKGESKNNFALKFSTEDFTQIHLGRSKVSNTFVTIEAFNKEKIFEVESPNQIKPKITALMEINHPFLARSIGFAKDENHLYFVYEFLEGRTLNSFIKQAKLNIPDTRFFSAQIILLIDYLHTANIIHRNINPKNLIIAKDGYLKLTNFATVKYFTPERTFTLCGAPSYMAPEMVLHKGHGKEVDWWGLGVLIYEMLTGLDPFYNQDPIYMYQQIANCQVDFPKSFDKSAKSLIKLLLVVDPKKRMKNIGIGACKLKKKAFFKGIDWDELITKKFEPTYKPSNNDFDISSVFTYPLDDKSVVKEINLQEDLSADW